MDSLGTAASPPLPPSADPRPRGAPEVAQAEGDEEKEEDPLDAFMKGIAAQTRQPSSSTPDAPPKPARFDDDSDGDLYAALGGRDDGAEEDDDDRGSDDASSADEDDRDDAPPATARRGKHIAALPPVDHSAITYIPIARPPYTPHPTLLPPVAAAMQARQSALDVVSVPPSITPPCPDFTLLPLPPAVVAVLSSALSSTSLTPIQAQAIPLALLHRDLVALAQTGSGKTLAYLLPLFLHVAAQPALSTGEGPIALVVVPTRELGEQVYVEARRLQRGWRERKWRVCAVLGGSNKHEQYRALLKGVELVVATPGRLLDLIAMGACRMQRCSLLMLDEADRLMSLGFDRQLRSIVGQIRPDRHTLLFSATMPDRVGRLCRDLLTDPVRVTAGTKGAVSDLVRQEAVIVKDEPAKLAWLQRQLPALLAVGPVLVFTNTQVSAVALHRQLVQLLPQHPSLPLHGGLHQHERLTALHRFKEGKLPVLVATDVAARGLDVKGIGAVVVWEVGKAQEGHVHRVGRVGRAGHEGRAITLLMEADGLRGGDVVAATMSEAGEAVPAALQPLLHSAAAHSPRGAEALLAVGVQGRAGHLAEDGTAGRAAGVLYLLPYPSLLSHLRPRSTALCLCLPRARSLLLRLRLSPLHRL